MTTLHRLSFMSEDKGYQLQSHRDPIYFHTYRVFADGPGNTRDVMGGRKCGSRTDGIIIPAHPFSRCTHVRCTLITTHHHTQAHT